MNLQKKTLNALIIIGLAPLFAGLILGLAVTLYPQKFASIKTVSLLFVVVDIAALLIAGLIAFKSRKS